MKFGRVLFLLLLASCNRQEPIAPEVFEPWRAQADKLQASIQPGMTDKEVLAIAGEPTDHKTIISGSTEVVWRYEVSPRIYLKVRFDRHDRVINTKLDSDYKIGGS